MTVPIEIDARGMRCPWPVLRLARAARDAGPRARIRIRADDPLAAREIAALAAERGWTIATNVEEPSFEILT